MYTACNLRNTLRGGSWETDSDGFTIFFLIVNIVYFYIYIYIYIYILIYIYIYIKCND